MTRLADLIASITPPRRRKEWMLQLAEVGLGDLETILQALPDTAWLSLKQAVLAQIDQCDPQRGLAQARDLLNEARAYHHLQRLGCEEVRFETATMLQKSPDLRAKLGGELVCCEVKTMHLTTAALPRTFTTKLAARLADAAAQLGPATEGRRRMIYLVGVPPVHRDIVVVLAQQLQPEIEIVLDA